MTDYFAALQAARMGAVLHLDLADPSGTTAVADIGSNGSYVGSPTLQVAGPSDVIPYGVDLDGSTQYVSHTVQAEYNVTDAITVECWVNLDSNVGPVLVARRTNTNYNWEMAVANDGKLLGRINANANQAESTATVPTGEWVHVVMTYDRVNIRTYINGAPDGTFAYTAAIGVLDANLSIGRRNFSGAEGWTNGKMAAVTIYNSALTAAEVYERYALGLDIRGHANSPVSY